MRRIGSAAAIRRSEVERSVWTLLVEVADVDVEDVLKVAAPEDQEPVEALPAHAADPSFGVGVRVRRLDRRPDDLDSFAPEDVLPKPEVDLGVQSPCCAEVGSSSASETLNS